MPQFRAFLFACLGYVLGVTLFNAFGPRPQTIARAPSVDYFANGIDRSPSAEAPANHTLITTNYYLWYPIPHDDLLHLNSPVAWPFDPQEPRSFFEPNEWEKNVNDLDLVGIQGLFLVMYSQTEDPNDVWSHSQGGIWQITRSLRRLQSKIKIAPQIRTYTQKPEQLFKAIYDMQIKPFFMFVPPEQWLMTTGNRPLIYLENPPSITQDTWSAVIQQIHEQFKTDFIVDPFFISELDNEKLDARVPPETTNRFVQAASVNNFTVETLSQVPRDQIVRPWHCHSENLKHPGFHSGDHPPMPPKNIIAALPQEGFKRFFDQIKSRADILFIRDFNHLSLGKTWARAKNYPRSENPISSYCAGGFKLGRDIASVSQSYSQTDDGRYLPDDFYLRNMQGLLTRQFASCPAAQEKEQDQYPPSGFVETVNCKQMAGWARDADTTKSISIEVIADGKLVLGTTAMGLRDDLPYNDKNHGFTLTLPFENDGKAHKIEVRALNADKSGTCSSAQENTLILKQDLLCQSFKDAHPPEGKITQADCKSITGWTRDADNSASTRIIVKERGGLVLYAGKASRPLTELPFPDKAHGFSIPVDFLDDKKPHTIEIFAENLDGSGKPSASQPNTLLQSKELTCLR